MIDLDLDSWRQVREQARDLEGTPLAYAMTYLLRERMAAALSDITNPSSTETTIRVAQGTYNAHKRDIMILEDLIRMASKAGQKARKSEENQ